MGRSGTVVVGYPSARRTRGQVPQNPSPRTPTIYVCQYAVWLETLASKKSSNNQPNQVEEISKDFEKLFLSDEC